VYHVLLHRRTRLLSSYLLNENWSCIRSPWKPPEKGGFFAERKAYGFSDYLFEKAKIFDTLSPMLKPLRVVWNGFPDVLIHSGESVVKKTLPLPCRKIRGCGCCLGLGE
jgi:hypothetical protein